MSTAPKRLRSPIKSQVRRVSGLLLSSPKPDFIAKFRPLVRNPVHPQEIKPTTRSRNEAILTAGVAHPGDLPRPESPKPFPISWCWTRVDSRTHASVPPSSGAIPSSISCRIFWGVPSGERTTAPQFFSIPEANAFPSLGAAILVRCRVTSPRR